MSVDRPVAPLSIPELFRVSAERWPAREAVRVGGETLSYAGLAAEVDAFAHGLASHGVRPGDRVAVFLPKRLECVVAMLAVLEAGAVLVPVNPALKPAQVSHIFANCTPRLVITLEDRARALEAHDPDNPETSRVPFATLDAGEWSAARGIPSWQSLRSPPEQTGPHTAPSQPLAALLYTSGTTGLSKGVVVSHRNLAYGVDSVVAYLGLDERDRILCSLPFSFDYGLNQLLSALAVGACAVLSDYFHAQQVLRMIESEHITGLAGVPTMWIQLAAQEWPAAVAANLRYITNSGDRLPPNTLAVLRARLPRTRIYLMYGFTEAFRGAYLDPALLDTHSDSIGKPIPHAILDVVDERGESVEPGTVGELVQRGPLVTCGYWEDDARTNGKYAHTRTDGLHADWVRSGDLAWRDADGFFYFIGRVDHLIKTAGYRVSRTEVEEVLHASGLVQDAAVIGEPHDVWGSQIVAFVSSNAECAVDAERLLQHCRRSMPRYMVPTRVVVLPSVPKTPNGKIDYAVLRASAAGTA